VTNALKYAFPEPRAGRVSLSLSRLDDQQCLLVVEDDGVGLPQALDLQRSRSMGAKIMSGLSKQLGGKLSIVSPPGTTIRLVFGQEPVSVSTARDRVQAAMQI
jgi:two-component system, sensor histidine kinase PdtaS